jgi:hypothetical protein
MDSTVKVDNSIRDYILLNKINTLYSTMTDEELKIAHSVIAVISDHLDKKHFTDKIEIDIKALVKTFGELDEIGVEHLIHKNS